MAFARCSPSLHRGGARPLGWEGWEALGEKFWVEDPGRESHRDQGCSQKNCKQL